MRLLTLALTSTIVAGAAHAGGAVMEPAPMAPAPMPAAMPSTDWTGPYLGLSLGYGAGTVDSDDPADLDFNGALGGVYGGYMYDLGNIVVGGELSYQATDFDFEQDDDLLEADSIINLKLKVGYDAGRLLAYGVAGASRLEITADVLDEDAHDTGYIIGGGTVFAITPAIHLTNEVLYHRWDDFNDTDTEIDAVTYQAGISYQF